MSAVVAESRAFERIPFKVAVQAGGGEQLWCGFTTDISAGGVFIATQACFPVGTVVEFDLVLNEQVTHVKGEVRWVRNGDCVTPGMGIRFVDLPADVVDRLNAVLYAGADTIFYDDE